MEHKCIVCQKVISKRNKKGRRSWEYSRYTCSRGCGERVKGMIEKKARSICPSIYEALDQGRELVIDPYVGDEYDIARGSLESRILNDITRPFSFGVLIENLSKNKLDQALANDLLALAERSVGSNTEIVEIGGNFFEVFEGGHIRICTGFEHYFEKVPGGWQEHRGDQYECKFLPSPVPFPKFGDIEGCMALNVIEHGFQILTERK